MYSITQNNIISNGNFNLLSDVIINFKNHYKSLTRKSIVNLFKYLDDKFFEEKSWKDDFYNKGFIKRTLITSIGEIHFKRRYYVSKNKDQHSNFFYIDSFFNITKYARITIDAIIELTKTATLVNGSYAAKHALLDCTVSRQSVTNILKKFKPLDNFNNLKLADNTEYKKMSKEVVYVELDEAHCSLQNKKNVVANLALVHTGHSIGTFASKRKELENKHYFGDLNADTSSFCDRIYDYIQKRYRLKDLKYIFVSGDGASWINSFTNKLRNCFKTTHIKIIQVLDKFHFRKRLTSIFSGNKKIINMIISELNSLNPEMFTFIANDFYDKNPNHKCNPNQFRKHVNYICNNFKYIKNNLHPKYKTPCSMEGHVSHVLAKRLTSRPKGFCKETLQSLIQLLILKSNNFKLTDRIISLFLKNTDKGFKYKGLRVNKYIKRYYDLNINLQIMNSNNSKLKEYFNNIISPKWFYS